jgi:hypothetical protein
MDFMSPYRDKSERNKEFIGKIISVIEELSMWISQEKGDILYPRKLIFEKIFGLIFTDKSLEGSKIKIKNILKKLLKILFNKEEEFEELITIEIMIKDFSVIFEDITEYSLTILKDETGFTEDNIYNFFFFYNTNNFKDGINELFSLFRYIDMYYLNKITDNDLSNLQDYNNFRMILKRIVYIYQNIFAKTEFQISSQNKNVLKPSYDNNTENYKKINIIKFRSRMELLVLLAQLFASVYSFHEYDPKSLNTIEGDTSFVLKNNFQIIINKVFTHFIKNKNSEFGNELTFGIFLFTIKNIFLGLQTHFDINLLNEERIYQHQTKKEEDILILIIKHIINNFFEAIQNAHINLIQLDTGFFDSIIVGGEIEETKGEKMIVVEEKSIFSYQPSPSLIKKPPGQIFGKRKDTMQFETLKLVVPTTIKTSTKTSSSSSSSSSSLLLVPSLATKPTTGGTSTVMTTMTSTAPTTKMTTILPSTTMTTTTTTTITTTTTTTTITTITPTTSISAIFGIPKVIKKRIGNKNSPKPDSKNSWVNGQCQNCGGHPKFKDHKIKLLFCNQQCQFEFYIQKQY